MGKVGVQGGRGMKFFEKMRFPKVSGMAQNDAWGCLGCVKACEWVQMVPVVKRIKCCRSGGWHIYRRHVGNRVENRVFYVFCAILPFLVAF